MRRSWNVWGLMLAVCLIGCSAETVGTEAAARKHFDTEFKKWMAGQENSVSTIASIGAKEPISFDIRSVVPDKPDFLAYDKAGELPKDWKTWPAYRFNVAIEWKSKAGTPTTDVATYNLTWNTSEKRWYVDEQL